MLRTTASVALALLIAGALPAQQPTSPLPRASTEKLFLGLALSGVSIKGDEEFIDDSETGGGISAQIGYGFTPRFALFAEGSAAALDVEGDDVALAHFDFGARFHFTNPSRALVPYLELAFSGRAVGQDDVVFDDGQGNIEEVDLEVTGTGITFGGGVQYFVTPKLAFNAGLKWTVGEFSTFKIDNISIDGLEVDATSTRLTLGLVFYPLTGRGSR